MFSVPLVFTSSSFLKEKFMDENKNDDVQIQSRPPEDPRAVQAPWLRRVWGHVTEGTFAGMLRRARIEKCCVGSDGYNVDINALVSLLITSYANGQYNITKHPVHEQKHHEPTGAKYVPAQTVDELKPEPATQVNEHGWKNGVDGAAFPKNESARSEPEAVGDKPKPQKKSSKKKEETK